MTIKLKNKETQTLADALGMHISIDANGSLSLSAKADDSVILGDIGITMDQLKAAQVREGQLLTATTAVGAPLAHEYLANNIDASEVRLQYQFGHTTHEVYFDRSGNTTNIATATAVGDNGDLAEVKSQISSLFAELNQPATVEA